MKNRSLFILIVIAFVIAPAIYFFVAGKNFENSDIRNILVGIQVLAGVVLLIVYGRKTRDK